DAVSAPVVSEGHGHLFDPTATGSVGCEAGVTGVAGNRTNVDDAPAAARDHAAAGDGLGEKKAAAQIRVEDEVPVVPGNLSGWLWPGAAGVVDQDVEFPVEGRQCLRGRGADAVLVAHVERHRD